MWRISKIWLKVHHMKCYTPICNVMLRCGALLQTSAEYSAVPISPMISQETYYSSPVRVRYGVSVVCFKSDSNYAVVITVLWAISWWTGPCNNGIWLYVFWNITTIPIYNRHDLNLFVNMLYRHGINHVNNSIKFHPNTRVYPGEIQTVWRTDW